MIAGGEKVFVDIGAWMTRGEVRLIRFPPPDKQRPAPVLTRSASAALSYLARVTVAPITSAVRGVPSELVLGVEDGMKHPCAVNLHNVMTVHRDRLGRRRERGGDRREEPFDALAACALPVVDGLVGVDTWTEADL